ncbi:MAG TPA: thioredoxin-dependent thiol peroxidase [Fluviicola sp.]|nr:thioredoxin-dependent thiol peroxidase [Fluviicola sp.]
MKLKVGDKVPLFETKDQDGSLVTNQQLQGKKWIVYFYPKDLTPGCTWQACSLRDGYDAIRKLGFHVLGVSMDNEKLHQRFREKKNLPFPLLADVEKNMIEAFGVWGPKKFMGRTYDGIHRTTFVINEQGIITHIIEKPNTKNHAEELIQFLK